MASQEILRMQAVLLSMQQPMPGHVFNIVDHDCSSRETALAYAASLIHQSSYQEASRGNPESLLVESQSSGRDLDAYSPGTRNADTGPHCAEMPQVGCAKDSPSVIGADMLAPSATESDAAPFNASSGQSGGKRVSNSKAVKLLAWKLRYPSFKDGLPALARSLELPPEV
jgi:hypothetical protein